ncbi:MAG: response regulator [Elusimicrobia bacterium]|nr:response regulator [Elusimicrobiota bacterium]
MKARLLIVDDDANFIETLKDSLKIDGWDIKILPAYSVQDALNVLSKTTPSLIILDVQLPDMHGTELLKILKDSARLKAVPVIFISARYTEPADRTEALLAGAGAFFSKPVNVDNLKKEIKYLLDKKNQVL